ncbi:MAG: type VI secretion system protein TssA [Candidatus Methylopumilus sp.]|nr:type VI secretion system protein TssA [Candidatus Methylopumilus sp.]
MAIDFQALLLPISEQAPGGIEARETPQYEKAFAEVERLSSVSSERPPDWPVVEAQATELLGTVSKDFLVAAWLSAAWIERAGVEGLSAGLGLFAGLLKDFWQTGYPSIKRLRGRRNAFVWWTDRVTVWLEATTIAALPAEEHALLVERLKEIDRTFSELDPEAPPLNQLVGLVERLDIVAQAPVVQETQTDAPALAGTAANPVSAPAVRATAGPAAVAVGSAGAQGSGPQLGSLAKVSNVDELVNALSPVLGYLGDVGEKLTAFDPFNSLSIGLKRFGARGALLTLPTSQGKTTLIAAPPFAEVQNYETICAANNPEGIIAFCEGRLATYPFWLDLDRQSALAYGAMGPIAAGMRSSVIDEVLAFVKRLPGVERLTFSDGTPFADEATRAWLATCLAERTGGGATDKFSEAKKQANERIGSGDSEGAVTVLQDFLSSTRSGRDQFRARVALVEMALGLKKDLDVQPLIDPLLDECERLNLTYWEPELALLAWSLQLRAARAIAKQLEDSSDLEKIATSQSAVQLALKKVSMLDFGEAMRQV